MDPLSEHTPPFGGPAHTPTPLHGLYVNPGQARELARLCDEHEPAIVGLPTRRQGEWMTVTLCQCRTGGDRRFGIDVEGYSWPFDQAGAQAA